MRRCLLFFFVILKFCKQVPNENVVLPSIETKDTVDYHIPTRTEINVLKLTAANAHAKVIAALKEYQLHSAKLEALEIEDEKGKQIKILPKKTNNVKSIVIFFFIQNC